MSAKEPTPYPDNLKRRGDNRPDHECFTNVNAPAPANCRPLKAPVAPPRPPKPYSERSPTFLTLKNIIMDDDSLSAEQKLGLIDKISELYS